MMKHVNMLMHVKLRPLFHICVLLRISLVGSSVKNLRTIRNVGLDYLLKN